MGAYLLPHVLSRWAPLNAMEPKVGIICWCYSAQVNKLRDALIYWEPGNLVCVKKKAGRQSIYHVEHLVAACGLPTGCENKRLEYVGQWPDSAGSAYVPMQVENSELNSRA